MTADRQGTTFRCDHAADPATPLLSPNIDFSAPWEVPTWLVFEGLRPIGPFTDCAEVPPSKSGHLATLGASSALLELPSPEYPQNPAFPLNGDVSAPCEVQAWVVFEGLCPIGPFTNWTKLPSPKTDYWATLGASNVPIGHAPGVAVPPRHYDNWNNWNNWCKWYSWFHTTSNLIWDSLSNFIQLWLKILCNVHVSLSRSVAIAAALDDLLGMRACLAHAMRSSNPNGWDDTQSPYLLGGWARCGYLCHFNMMDHRHLLILTVGAPVRTTIVTAKAFLLCTIRSVDLIGYTLYWGLALGVYSLVCTAYYMAYAAVWSRRALVCSVCNIYDHLVYLAGHAAPFACKCVDMASMPANSLTWLGSLAAYGFCVLLASPFHLFAYLSLRFVEFAGMRDVSGLQRYSSGIFYGTHDDALALGPDAVVPNVPTSSALTASPTTFQWYDPTMNSSFAPGGAATVFGRRVARASGKAVRTVSAYNKLINRPVVRPPPTTVTNVDQYSVWYGITLASPAEMKDFISSSDADELCR